MLKEASLRAKKRAWSAANDNERPAIRVEIKQIQKARQRINISIAQAKQRLQGLRRQRYQEALNGWSSMSSIPIRVSFGLANDAT